MKTFIILFAHNIHKLKMNSSAKSVLVTHFGGYDSLKITEHPLPEWQDDFVEVEVHYCGVNFADLYSRQGLIPKENMPFVLGMECSGLITAVGKNVADKFEIGKQVVCYDYNGGLYRTKIRINQNKCFTVFDSINLQEAAAIFVNYLTAYFSLLELGNLRANQHVFINSCAGGVGWAATQLAGQVSGVTIYGTTSPFKANEVTLNGVNHVLRYDTYKQKIREIQPDGLDLILDNQAGENFESNLQLLKPFGKLVLIGANNIIRDANQLNLEVFQTITTHLSVNNLIVDSTCVAGLHLGIIAEKNPLLIQTTLDVILKMLLEKQIQIKIDSLWSLDEIVDATKVLQERRNIGKVLLYIDHNC